MDVGTVPAKRRTGPKSKQTTEKVAVVTDKPVEMQKELRIVLEKVDESTEMHRMTRASKRKADAMAAASESSEQLATEAETVDTEKDVKPLLSSLPEPKPQPNESSDAKPIEIKNTTLSYTVKSNKCLLCAKNTPYLSTHYTNNHDEYEVYSARMSSKKADQLRRNPAKSSTRADGKLNAYCYYCENNVNLNRNKWIDHLIRHTGEYTRNCKKCGCRVTSKSDRSKCTHPDPTYKSIVEFTDTLFVYMCNYCNYTQSQEENMQKHIRNMHEMHLNVQSQYQKITLIPNFGRTRAAQRAISADGSESSLSLSNNDSGSNAAAAAATATINIEAFMPTNQNEDEINDAKWLLESTNNESADASASAKRGTAGQSIIDRLKARFDSGNNQLENPIKEEGGATESRELNQPRIVYRAPDDMSKNAKRTAGVADDSSASASSLRHGTVIENVYKFEANKTEANATMGSNEAAAAANDGDDSADDEDQNWESVSSGSEHEDDTNTPNNHISRLIISKGIPKSTNKTVRSRQQQQKKRSISSMVCKAEKSDDNAVPADDSKQKSPAEVRPIVGDVLRVDHIGWSECLGIQKYYCNIGNCDYISQNNPDSLSNHFQKKHGNEAWTGYCHKCDQQIFNRRVSLMKEFDHWKQFHLPKKALTPKPSPSAAAASKANELRTAAQILAESVSISTVPDTPIVPPQPQPPSKPLIRLRRMSELLQEQPSTSSSPPMLLQPIQFQPSPSPSPSPFVISNVLSLKNPNPLEFGNVIGAPAVPIVSDNPLKPWTTCPTTKSSHAEAKLRRECSLLALFKCMAMDCIFTTSNKDKMLQHLQNHEDHASDSFNASTQYGDDCWLECCYCEEVPGSCITLVDHIIEEHSTSSFQCPQCFYRSVDSCNVISHLEKYHGKGSTPSSVLICGSELKNLNIDLIAIKAAREKVQKFKCPESGKF